MVDRGADPRRGTVTVTVDDHDDDDFDTTVDDDDDDDKQPTKEEFARMQRALTKANAEAKKNRLRYKAILERTVGGKSGDKEGAGDGKDADKNRELDRERIRNDVSEAEEAKWKKRVVRQAAKAALLEAGLQGDPAKLARLVDENEVEVDDDGDISDGLDEQVEQLKEDYPDLFEDKNAPPPKATRRGRIDGGNRDRPPAKKLSSAEIIQQRALRTAKRR